MLLKSECKGSNKMYIYKMFSRFFWFFFKKTWKRADMPSPLRRCQAALRYISSFIDGKAIWYFTARNLMRQITMKVMSATHVTLRLSSASPQ